MTADIEIFQGDTIGFNDEKPYKITIDSEIDVTGFTAELTVAGIKQVYPIDEGYFYFLLSTEESSKISRGLYDLRIRIFDTEQRVKTICTNLRMVVK